MSSWKKIIILIIAAKSDCLTKDELAEFKKKVSPPFISFHNKKNFSEQSKEKRMGEQSIFLSVFSSQKYSFLYPVAYLMTSVFLQIAFQHQKNAKSKCGKLVDIYFDILVVRNANQIKTSFFNPDEQNQTLNSKIHSFT